MLLEPLYLMFGQNLNTSNIGGGPNGFKNTIHEMDERPGGLFRLMMHSPDGSNYPYKIIYIEVVEPKHIVYKHSGENETEAVNFQVIVTFEDVGDKTLLPMHSVFPSKEELDFVLKEYHADEGGIQTLN